MYSFRAATSADQDAVYELYREIMGQYIARIWGWNEEWQRNDFLAHFKPEHITLACDQNAFVGYSHVEDQDDRVFLRMLVIHPLYQRHGIGAALLGSFIRSGKQQAKRICLEVFKINSEAKRFYEKRGFKVEGETARSYVMMLN